MVYVRFAFGLLRRHILRRADDHARFGQACAGSFLLRAGNAEIHQFDVQIALFIFMHQSVRGLDVAVNHALTVRVVQGLGHLAQNGNTVGEGQPPPLRQQIG